MRKSVSVHHECFSADAWPGDTYTDAFGMAWVYSSTGEGWVYAGH